MLNSFMDLDVWKYAHNLVLQVYKMTSGFPEGEKYGLVSQMRRAAVSVPANIAEGFKRRGKKEKRQFYYIALGSLEELRYFFILVRDLEYRIDYHGVSEDADKISRMLYSEGAIPQALAWG